MISNDALYGGLGLVIISVIVVSAFFAFACILWALEVLYAWVKSWRGPRR